VASASPPDGLCAVIAVGAGSSDSAMRSALKVNVRRRRCFDTVVPPPARTLSRAEIEERIDTLPTLPSVVTEVM